MSLTAAIFVIAFISGCVLAFKRHPVFGVATYVATFFLSPPLRWWGQGLLYSVRWSFIAAGVTLLAIMVAKKAQKPALPLMSHGFMWLYVMFLLWLFIQFGWALNMREHAELTSYYMKFGLGIILLYFSVDSEQSIKVVLWSIVGGCFYFGWIAFTTYLGGRFEGFGGAGIGEANAGALTMVIGTLIASSLFLVGNFRDKAILFGCIPFILNGLVTTISRSGFLALAAGGLAFLFFSPQKYKKQIRLLAGLAVVLFIMLTGPSYWNRMQSIQQAGETVQGVDTGQDRMALIKVQWRIFFMHPLGCGATCTTVLSKNYLEDKYLAASGEGRERASHNTFMTMIVDHGIPGAVFYIGLLLWVVKSLFVLRKGYRGQTGLRPVLLPAVAACFAAMTVGDMFVTYAKYEIRIWMLTLLMGMLSLEALRVKQEKAAKAGGTVPAGKTAQRPNGRTIARPPAPTAISKSPAAGGGSETPSGLR